ncbi:Fc.00g071320.m01.CDS01 [Cosmosporella sp. VM-42]
MPFFQPPITPLPPGIDLSGKTALVTGATAGIGLEIARQLLTLKISTLVFAVRNVSKGEAVKKSLLAEPAIRAANPKASVKVMKVDAEDYKSPQELVASFKSEFKELHLLMLNAGIGTLDREKAPTGHEKNVQVNYLSNVLLTLAFLPILEATAEKTGAPTRITWTGSRAHVRNSLAERLPLKEGEPVLKHLDTADGIPAFDRYGDSKLLVTLWLLELAKHYNPEKVVINNFCPGMVDTAMTDVLPFYLRLPVAAVKKMRARSPEKAGWVAINAAVLVGPETHGKLLADKAIEEPFGFLISTEGQRVQKLLWNETRDEMEGLVAIPPWMRKLT